MTPEFWKGRRVLVTGHTGFKGSWLCLWLQSMGAEVHGIALPPEYEPCMFCIAQVEPGMASSHTVDIRNLDALVSTVSEISPEIVFHLAAQPLVRYSYHQPVETYSVNVMGVVNLLEAVRSVGTVNSILNITTDKCYENHEWLWGYRENDPLGGHDPYSSSKACSELVTMAYRDSFFADAGVAIATARAGNVIGGGDWATDRLLPDIFRAIDSGKALTIRAPDSTRPWQHVLEPIAGYLMLAEKLHNGESGFAEAWNFGPSDDDVRSVAWIVEYVMSRVTGLQWHQEELLQPHEANYLKLDSSKARNCLAWKPRWTLQQALDKALEWHLAWRNGQDMRVITLSQIDEYQLNGSI